MTFRTNPLDHVKVASPCPADWDAMIGNERVRFCGQCQLNVYNLSGMSKREAEALVTNTEGRLCVRYFSRADGTILTKNCPVGLRALKRRVSRVARATMSAVLGFLSGVGFNFALSHGGSNPVIEHQTMGAITSKDFDSNDLKLVESPAPTKDWNPRLIQGEIIVPEQCVPVSSRKVACLKR